MASSPSFSSDAFTPRPSCLRKSESYPRQGRCSHRSSTPPACVRRCRMCLRFRRSLPFSTGNGAKDLSATTASADLADTVEKITTRDEAVSAGTMDDDADAGLESARNGVTEGAFEFSSDGKVGVQRSCRKCTGEGFFTLHSYRIDQRSTFAWLYCIQHILNPLWVHLFFLKSFQEVVVPPFGMEGMIKEDVRKLDLQAVLNSDSVFNPELSWLSFNWRVLWMAADKRTPLFERLRFIAITSRNLDEFFGKRVGGLKRQVTV